MVEKPSKYLYEKSKREGNTLGNRTDRIERGMDPRRGLSHSSRGRR